MTDGICTIPCGDALYQKGMMVKPPIVLKSPQEIVEDEVCDFCGRKGKNCLNSRYGRFCVGVVYRYYRNNKETYDEKVAVDRFKMTFNYVKD